MSRPDMLDAHIRLRRLLPEPEPISLDAVRERRQRGAEIVAWIHERYGPDGKRSRAR